MKKIIYIIATELLVFAQLVFSIFEITRFNDLNQCLFYSLIALILLEFLPKTPKEAAKMIYEEDSNDNTEIFDQDSFNVIRDYANSIGFNTVVEPEVDDKNVISFYLFQINKKDGDFISKEKLLELKILAPEIINNEKEYEIILEEYKEELQKLKGEKLD